jgi:predicted dehydrogenase
MSTDQKYRVGIQGCGVIFPQYVEGMQRYPELELAWAADLDGDRLASLQKQFNIPSVGTPEQMLADPSVDVVINLTWPGVHHQVSSAALRAGKHVFSEKVIALTTSDAQDLINIARERGLRLGSAPETFLGSWGATSRAVLDSGLIGEVIGGVAFVTHNYLEFGHPDPRFLFQDGAGPALDRGPYYVAALVNLLGPVAEVCGMTAWGPRERIMRHPQARVDSFTVEIPTHWTASLRFVSGPVVTVVFSSDIWANSLPEMEIYGTAGTMKMPNPNYFDGDVHVASIDRGAPFRLVKPPLEPRGNYRGRGVVDMLTADSPRASGEFALHTLEVLRAIEESSNTGATIRIRSSLERPRWPELDSAADIEFDEALVP